MRRWQHPSHGLAGIESMAIQTYSLRVNAMNTQPETNNFFYGRKKAQKAQRNYKLKALSHTEPRSPQRWLRNSQQLQTIFTMKSLKKHEGLTPDANGFLFANVGPTQIRLPAERSLQDLECATLAWPHEVQTSFKRGALTRMNRIHRMSIRERHFPFLRGAPSCRTNVRDLLSKPAKRSKWLITER
jgi:hypothetical protein